MHRFMRDEEETGAESLPLYANNKFEWSPNDVDIFIPYGVSRRDHNPTIHPADEELQRSRDVYNAAVRHVTSLIPAIFPPKELGPDTKLVLRHPRDYDDDELPDEPEEWTEVPRDQWTQRREFSEPMQPKPPNQYSRDLLRKMARDSVRDFISQPEDLS